VRKKRVKSSVFKILACGNFIL